MVDVKFASSLLAKQLKELQENDIGASIGLEDDNNLFIWDIIISGPSDTLYEGGYFKAKMKFPNDYPNSPPELRFISRMWHPNIYEDGRVCISILHPPVQYARDCRRQMETHPRRGCHPPLRHDDALV